MSKKIKLELLAPAKNYELGCAAINCGADALYIGAPNFGARKAAANSIEDIKRLTQYAHLFDVKVYVAFNTIIYDDEIDDAERMVDALYEVGVDALIVQDMAFAKMKIPPIKLFASTQTANLTLERVQFLEAVGFERVILERALSKSEIENICQNTEVDIECFVHGAICVSYSGNCYLSEAVAQRSANRGVCAQPCRSLYNLFDEDDNLLLKNRHLLSIKDLSLSDSVDELIEAGVTSFKIEGRLKDIVYLKNSVSYFNSKIDRYIKEHSHKYERASKGVSKVEFTPNPARSFSRQFTPYFFNGKTKDISTFDSAKSVGEYIGEVASIRGNKVILAKGGKKGGFGSSVELNSGDGICFFASNGHFSGTYVNKFFGDSFEVARVDEISAGCKIYRNYDKKFVDTLNSSVEKRYLDIQFEIYFGKAVIRYGEFECSEEFECDEAKNIEKAVEGLTTNFSKSGDSIFNVQKVRVVAIEKESKDKRVAFLPIKVQNGVRNSLFEKMQQKIADTYPFSEGQKLKPAQLSDKKISYKANVANNLAFAFYKECGAEEIEQAVELNRKFEGVELMRTSYCLRREIGRCLKEGGDKRSLYIVNNNRRLDLKFDCKNCEMVVFIIHNA